jgi:YD repeat-containing protein
VKTNNATTSLQYDSYARPTQTTSPTGAVTTFAYTTSPPTVTATTNGRWTKTTLDGLGRTLKAESGDGSGTKSIVDYEYDSCGCSPTGKLKRKRPRNPS